MGWTAVADPGGAKHALQVERDGALYLGTVGHVYKSTDRGDSWSEIGSGGLPSTSSIQCIALAPDNTLCIGNTTISSIHAQVWRYTGGAWVVATGIPTNLTLKISALLRAYGSEFFAGTAFNGDLYRSLDNGANWSLYAPNAKIIDPASAPGAIWILLLVDGGRIACGCEADPGGLFRDPRILTGGQSLSQWKNIGPFNVDGYNANVRVAFSDLNDKDGVIVCSRRRSSDGKIISRSLSEGVWSTVSSGIVVSKFIAGLGKDVSGAWWMSQQYSGGTFGETYRSTNKGTSWAKYEAGFPGAAGAVWATSFAYDDTYIYAVGNDDIIYRAPAGG